MKIHYLDNQHYLFGNKGAVWSNKIHIWEKGNMSTTMCGTPGLSSNWAAIEEKTQAGCPECIYLYIKGKIKEWMDTDIQDRIFQDWLADTTDLSLEEAQILEHKYRKELIRIEKEKS